MDHDVCGQILRISSFIIMRLTKCVGYVQLFAISSDYYTQLKHY